MRKLTFEEIETLASRKGVKRIAVENFLMTVEHCEKKSHAQANLYHDARLYKWNAPTIKAIADGIRKAF